ncbi:Protein jagged-1 [Amphibalanus amphitrite]|uniref:Protein jagged-1 n=1 Tax=Amphibalanus amphitrite TaxID=1232801 RepID=A0A6A4WJM5_AMPAM|nr:Protein jagged-1 [Amphibalanus amphitrite]
MLYCLGARFPARAFFELQIQKVQNPSGERRDGSCCGDAPRGPGDRCPLQCRTSFRLCLKEYQNPVLTTGLCNFGSTSSAVIDGNSFRMTEMAANATLRLPFTFSWMTCRSCGSDQMAAFSNHGRKPSGAFPRIGIITVTDHHRVILTDGVSGPGDAMLMAE